MDAFEKWFDKMEAERKLAEAEDTKKKLDVKMEGVIRPSDKIPDEIKPSDKIEVKKELSEKWEEKIGHLQKYKTKLSHLIKLKSNKKPSANVKPKKKPNDQIKVFKFSNDISTVKIIPDIWVKEVQLKNHVLVVDHNIDENGFKDEMLIMIKSAGIDYIIAPGFEEEFYKKASDSGLHLIECSDTKLIDEGKNIKVYLEEGVIFDVDNGQELKFKLITNSVRRSILKKIRIGECLLIGDNLTIKVLDIEKDQIKICINALKVITAYQHKCITIGDKIKIIVFKIILDQFNLVIEAPEAITINRK